MPHLSMSPSICDKRQIIRKFKHDNQINKSLQIFLADNEKILKFIFLPKNLLFQVLLRAVFRLQTLAASRPWSCWCGRGVSWPPGCGTWCRRHGGLGPSSCWPLSWRHRAPKSPFRHSPIPRCAGTECRAPAACLQQSNTHAHEFPWYVLAGAAIWNIARALRNGAEAEIRSRLAPYKCEAVASAIFEKLRPLTSQKVGQWSDAGTRKRTEAKIPCAGLTF